MLEQSTPANDAVVQTAPREVTLRFSEPVTTQPDAIRVFDASGGRVDSGPVTRPASNTVATKLRPNLVEGTYTVAWRAVSADSHPVFGAFVFHVGAPGANPEGIGAQVLQSEETPKTVSVTFTAVRFFSFALILLCGGGTAVLALALGAAEDRVRSRLLGAVAALAAALVFVSLAGIVLQGASAQALGLGDAFRWGVVEPVLDTRFGQVWLARSGIALLLAGAAAWLRRGRGPDWLLDVSLVLCAGLVLSPAASGHASVGGAAAFVADVVHVQAAAVWAGGLAFLLLALLLAGARRWELARSAVPRFSTMAVVSVVALLVAGVVNGYLEIRSWSGLWDTTFGKLVIVKAGLVLPIVALGLYNNRVSVPRLRAGAGSMEGRRFLRSTAVELAVMVAVVAVTAVLVAEPPAKALATRSGPYSTVADIGPLEVNLVVDPARPGTNAIHVYLLRKTGQPADVAEVDVFASLASAGIEPLHFDAKRLAPGHYAVSGAQLAPAGDWRLRIEARKGEFDLYVQTVSVPIESP